MSYSYEIKWCSLPWSGPRGRHAETDALRDDLQDNCKQGLRFWGKLEITRNYNALIYGAFCDINKSLVKSVWNYTLSFIQDLFCFYYGQQNSRHGKSHRFLFPFSSKFPDLNFAPYVLYIYLNYIKPVRNTNSEPGLPVIWDSS